MSNPAHRERLMQVLLGPHISEKATRLAEAGQIVFRVRSDATKSDVRQAVELLFEVKVERVSVVRIPAKTKALRSARRHASTFKKAYVRLAPGQDINFMGAE